MATYLFATPLFGIGVTEAMIIGAAVLVLFGATRLPKLGRGIGEGIRNFKTGLKGESDNSLKNDGENSTEEEKGTTA